MRSRPKSSLICMSDNQHGVPNTVLIRYAASAGVTDCEPGIRVKTENVSKAEWPARTGLNSRTAARQTSWAACARSSAATATLVSAAHLPLVGISPALDVRVGYPGIPGFDDRPTIGGGDHPSMATLGGESDLVPFHREFELGVLLETEPLPDLFGNDDPARPVD